MKTFKLLLADDKCCAQLDSILHKLPKYNREYLADCPSCEQSGRDFHTVCAGCGYYRY